MRTLLLSFGALVAVGCGPTTPSVTMADFFPADNEVGSYVKDSTGLQTAKGATAIEGLVDGAGSPFTAKGAQALGWMKYTSGTYKLDARVWQMKDAANATDTYTALLTDAPLYAANTWTDLAVGQAGRIADTGSSYWVSARKNAFLIEVVLQPKDTTSRADVETFAKAMVAKLP